MSARPMTRRSVLALGAGAMAGGLLGPGGALAALADPPPSLSEQWLGRLAMGASTIELARHADLVGVQWQAPAEAGIELRFRERGGTWSGWVSAGRHGHGPEAPAAGDTLVGEPVWTGGASAVQLRATRALSGVRLHLIDVSGGLGARRVARMLGPLASAAALAHATPVLAAGAGQPPIIARRAWARGVAHPRVAPSYGAVRMAFVHHTENPNGYAPGEVPAMLRAIYAFHRYVNGWNDIGYNFVLDSYGRIFEARAGGIDEPVIGAHAGGYNLASTGVAVLGSFSSAPISPAARRALERLLAWKLSLHGVPAQGSVTVRVNPAGASYSRFPANARVPLPRIAGHRDADSTDCPGGALYRQLPGIRPRVLRLAGRATRATLELSGAVAPAPSPPPPGAEPAPAPTLLGSVQFLDGAPIAGATVQLQARSVSRKGEVVSERTIAQALTDAQGRWSLPASVAATGAAGVWLRALCAGSAGVGAAVSEPLHLPAPVSPPAPAPAPTAPAPAPPAP
jgi:hypothetical protein